MNKEIKYIDGQVIEKTVNSVKVKNSDKTLWIKFFDEELIKNVQTSNSYRFGYTDNVKNNKTYHNGNKVEEIVKPAYVEDDVMAENTIKPKYISDTTINTLIMTIKEIYLGLLNKDKQVSLKSITNDVLDSYDTIIKSL